MPWDTTWWKWNEGLFEQLYSEEQARLESGGGIAVAVDDPRLISHRGMSLLPEEFERYLEIFRWKQAVYTREDLLARLGNRLKRFWR